MAIDEGKKIDHQGTHEPVCPWCGKRSLNHWDVEEGECDCPSCGRPFALSRSLVPYYTTARLATCPDCGRPQEVNPRTGAFSVHHVYGTHDRCPGSRKEYRE